MHYSDTLQHHGILGMKWGIRRYQNKDGSLTAAGKARQKSSTSDTSSITKKSSAATAVGTLLAGPVVGVTAGLISSRKVSDLNSNDVETGKSSLKKKTI